MEKYLNKIIEGDALEGLKELPDECVDLVVTDPPYFLPVNSYVGTRGSRGYKRTLADTSILKGYFDRIFEEINRVVKPNATLYVFLQCR